MAEDTPLKHSLPSNDPTNQPQTHSDSHNTPLQLKIPSPKTLPVPNKSNVHSNKSTVDLRIQIHSNDIINPCVSSRAPNLEYRFADNDYILHEIEDFVNTYSFYTSQCSSKTDANNEYNTAVNKDSDDNNNNSNNNQNNNHYNSGGSGFGSSGGNNGSSDGKDDDEKKNDKNNHITDSDEADEIEEEKKQEEDDELDENNMASASNLSVNAPAFQPLNQSKSATLNQSALTTVHEEKMHIHSVHVTSHSHSAPNTDTNSNQNKPFMYIPNRFHRAQGMIQISKHLTEYVIPRAIKENYIENVYDFMDKYTAINLYNGNFIDCTVFRIFNYGFHDNADNVLYCIADRKNAINQRNYRYVMRDKLYTTYDILKLYDLPPLILPKCAEIMSSCMEIQDKFSNAAALCQSVIFKTKWHKMRVFNRIHNINKQRLTFSITKTEFVDVVQRFIHNDEKKVLIPIVMFNSTGYRVEYVQIVPLRDNIHIGISYAYITDNNCKYGVKVTGIHINKNIIRNQHQLASPHHDCHCLDAFKSDIDCLHIGNPDDDKNRSKDLKKKHDALKNVNKQLIEINTNMKQENESLRKSLSQYYHLMNQVQQQQQEQQQQQLIQQQQQQQLINTLTPIITPQSISTATVTATGTVSGNTPNSVLSNSTPSNNQLIISPPPVYCLQYSNPQMHNNNIITPRSTTSTPQSTPVTPQSVLNMTFSQVTNLINNNNNAQVQQTRSLSRNNSLNVGNIYYPKQHST